MPGHSLHRTYAICPLNIEIVLARCADPKKDLDGAVCLVSTQVVNAQFKPQLKIK